MVQKFVETVSSYPWLQTIALSVCPLQRCKLPKFSDSFFMVLRSSALSPNAPFVSVIATFAGLSLSARADGKFLLSAAPPPPLLTLVPPRPGLNLAIPRCRPSEHSAAPQTPPPSFHLPFHFRWRTGRDLGQTRRERRAPYMTGSLSKLFVPVWLPSWLVLIPHSVMQYQHGPW